MNKMEKSVRRKVWRVMIVDDHPLLRLGLKSLIDLVPELEVCCETSCAKHAMTFAKQNPPDLAIIDLSLSGSGGLELVKWLKSNHPALKSLVCSMHDESLFAHRALNAGAWGYINKQEATTHIIDAVRHILQGKIWLSETMTERTLLNITKGGSVPGGSYLDLLSDRELEVFELIGQGLGTSEIAERLHLSVKTIETHREKIKRKLNLGTGNELTRQAIQWILEQN